MFICFVKLIAVTMYCFLYTTYKKLQIKKGSHY